VAPPTSPSQPRGLGPSLSPLKGGEGLVSAGIILVERDASRAIKFSSPDSPALDGEGWEGVTLPAAQEASDSLRTAQQTPGNCSEKIEKLGPAEWAWRSIPEAFRAGDRSGDGLLVTQSRPVPAPR
jgi:hypothetical protein